MRRICLLGIVIYSRVSPTCTSLQLDGMTHLCSNQENTHMEITLDTIHFPWSLPKAYARITSNFDIEQLITSLPFKSQVQTITQWSSSLSDLISSSALCTNISWWSVLRTSGGTSSNNVHSRLIRLTQRRSARFSREIRSFDSNGQYSRPFSMVDWVSLSHLHNNSARFCSHGPYQKSIKHLLLPRILSFFFFILITAGGAQLYLLSSSNHPKIKPGMACGKVNDPLHPFSFGPQKN